MAWSPCTRERLPSSRRNDTIGSAFNTTGLIDSLLEGTAEDVGLVFRSAFKLREELDDLLGWDDEYDNDILGPGPFDLETSLILLLADAVGTWTVGETREKEFPYWPFRWQEES